MDSEDDLRMVEDLLNSVNWILGSTSGNSHIEIVKKLEGEEDAHYTKVDGLNS